MALSLSVHGASAATKLKEQVQQAAQNDTAAGAAEICVCLNQALSMAHTQKLNIHAQREWEEIANDCQDAIARMRSPEALQTFTRALSRMPAPGQAVLLLGHKDQAPAKDLDDQCVKLLGQTQDFQVQVACLELLGKHRVKEGVEPALKFLKATNAICIQVAACRALAMLPDKRAVSGLIAFLRSHKGGRMRYEATAALRAITGQAFNADASTWEGWWGKHEASFAAPASSEPVYNFETIANPKEELTYYEIPIVENRVVFIMDTSGSMTLGGSPNRFEKTRDQLKELILRLDEKGTLFNIIQYSTSVRRWQKNHPLVPATAANKQAASAFLDQTKPVGGTQTMLAMEEALREVALINGVETVFLLTDGAPQPMKHSGVTSIAQLPKGNADIRRRIRYINQTLKVRVHTVGIYTRVAADPPEQDQASMRDFLEGVAKENDGVYKEVP